MKRLFKDGIVTTMLGLTILSIAVCLVHKQTATQKQKQEQ